MSNTYKVVRKFQRDEHEDELVAEGLTLEEAKAHCNDKQSSSRTCTLKSLQAITRSMGEWFDAYYPEVAEED